MTQSTQLLNILAFVGAIFGFFGLIIAIIATSRTNKIRKEMAVLFSGKEAIDLEAILLSHSKELGILDKEIQELFEISNRIHSLAMRSVHKVGIIRFNPFKDIGGDQSFALALLDGKDCGIVISSLHTREGTRIYSKPVNKGVSEKYTLTEEEKAAIKEANTIKPSKL